MINVTNPRGTVETGDGNDVVNVAGNGLFVRINKNGAGSLTVNGNASLVIGGEGNDTVNGFVGVFDAGGGNDIVRSDTFETEFALPSLISFDGTQTDLGSVVRTFQVSFLDASVDDIVTERDGDNFIVRLGGSDDSITFEGFSETDTLRLNFGPDETNSFRLSGDGVIERATDDLISYQVAEYRKAESFDFVRETLSVSA